MLDVLVVADVVLVDDVEVLVDAEQMKEGERGEGEENLTCRCCSCRTCRRRSFKNGRRTQLNNLDIR